MTREQVRDQIKQDMRETQLKSAKENMGKAVDRLQAAWRQLGEAGEVVLRPNVEHAIRSLGHEPEDY